MDYVINVNKSILREKKGIYHRYTKLEVHL